MQPFAAQVAKNLDKVGQIPRRSIAPSHGPVWARPSFIVDAYRDWATAAPRNVVCLPYVTMHGSTRLMVEHLTGALVERGVTVERFDLTTVDTGDLATRWSTPRRSCSARRPCWPGRIRWRPMRPSSPTR